jgi:hypothetical protein
MKKYTLILFLSLFSNVFSQTVPEPERVRTYDVKHISMNISFDWDQKMVIGDVTTTIVPLTNGMTSFEVDAVAFDIKSIMVLDIPLRYDYDGKKITIYTPQPVNASDTFGYTVQYTCKPQRGLYFIYPTELNPSLPYQIWTQGQSENNRYWIPCYDYPNDKTTSELFVTVDSKFTTLSNGYLESTYESASIRGGTTYHWVQDLPHSTYLIMLAVGEWDIVKDEADGIEILTYVDKNKFETGKYSARNTAEMLRMFNHKFGYRYPWANYKQVIVSEYIHGGMENTSATVLNERVYYDPQIEEDYGADGLIAHELGHQWWGDLITCSNWSELWLNESFATYSAAMWYEHYKGKDEYDYYLLRNADDAVKYDSTKKRLPIWAGYGSVTENIYDKGSVVINSFRHVLGDSIFDLSLSTFLRDNEFKNVVSDDLVDAIDKVFNYRTEPGPKPTSHDWMFYQWIRKAGYPEFEVAHSYDENKKEMYFNLKQVQKQDTLTPSFQVPVDLRIYGSGHDTIVPIFISGTNITWTIPFPVKPDFVQFDYGNNILDKTNFKTKTLEHTMSQFENSENAIDRIMAIRREKDYLTSVRSEIVKGSYIEYIIPVETLEEGDTKYNTYKQFYDDPFLGTRKEAIDFYSFLMDNPYVKSSEYNTRDNEDGDNSDNKIHIDGIIISQVSITTLTDFIRSKYDSEPSSRVKRAMLTALGKSSDKADIDFIKNKVASETNEYIISDGIKALMGSLSKDEMFNFAMPYIFRPSHRWIITNTVVDALDSADNSSPDDRIKEALISVAFGADIESRTRTNAITALLDYARDPQVTELAKRYVNYNFRETEQALIKLLGRSGDKTLVAFLEEMKKETTDPSITKSIDDALKELNG